MDTTRTSCLLSPTNQLPIKTRMTLLSNQILLSQRQQRQDEKLPLAVLVHYNFYFSFIFAILMGRLVFEKYGEFYFCNVFQRNLLVPMYCVWFLIEIPRLYVGMKGVLRDKLPDVAAFVLLSFFPQIWIALYFALLQEIILPFDSVLGIIMMLVVLTEIVLAWKFLRCIITRQSALFYNSNNR